MMGLESITVVTKYKFFTRYLQKINDFCAKTLTRGHYCTEISGGHFDLKIRRNSSLETTLIKNPLTT